MTPERTCIACRRKAPKGELVRLVADVDGEPQRDDAQRLPGRGAYLHPACLDSTLPKGALSRAFRASPSRRV